MQNRSVWVCRGSAFVSDAGFGAAPKRSFLTSTISISGNTEEKSAIAGRARQHPRRARYPLVFGALFVVQAALPYLREQGSGHILQVSSIGGISAFPNIGIYNASKWALEAFSQSLAAEVADFGIKVTIIEPGAYSTDWSGSSAKHAEPNPAYDASREKAAEQRRARAGNPGDPVATRDAVLQFRRASALGTGDAIDDELVDALAAKLAT